MKTKVISYWATTALIVAETLAGGLTDLPRGQEIVVVGEPVVDVVTSLGYPEYVLKVLGTWKLLGAIALLVPGCPRLKEWAYAGIVFELTGAAASQAARRHSVSNIITPVVLAGLALASWALRPPSRTLGALFPEEDHQATNAVPVSPIIATSIRHEYVGQRLL